MSVDGDFFLASCKVSSSAWVYFDKTMAIDFLLYAHFAILVRFHENS